MSSNSDLNKIINSNSTFYLDDTASNHRPIDEVKEDNDMEDFLQLSRNGNNLQISEILESLKQNDTIQKCFDINYRGKKRKFYGWSALHLSCFFNQIDTVKLLLQFPNVDINICNYENDTPIHKACLTSRYQIVEMLLTNNADINIKNNNGQKPKELATDLSLKKLMQAAEKSENHKIQKQFFEAITNNELDLINKLIKSKNFNLNCTDTFGNTALHLASNRNQLELATLLVEKGISTVIKNNNQLTALDLAKTKEMKEIIGYVPFTWRKYEGVLFKKRKFLGYKEYYVVLNKGLIIYYQNKKDATNDSNRKGVYILNNAIIKDHPSSSSNHEYPVYSWTINYTNGRKHTLCCGAPLKKKSSELANENNRRNANNFLNKRPQLDPAERKKKWIQAINEHIKYSDSHQTQQNESQLMMPIESLQQSLNTLRQDEDKLNFLLTQVEQQLASVTISDLNQLPASSNIYQTFSSLNTNFESLKAQIKTLIHDSNKCLSLHEQRDSIFKSKLAETRHKCELLEQSLRVLAQENHDLEAKKLHDQNVRSRKTSRNVSPSPITTKLSTDTEVENETGNISADSDDQFEEFFDIADDPLTDEEQENEDNLTSEASIDTKSLMLRSCYGSLSEIGNNNSTDNNEPRLSIVTSKTNDPEIDSKKKENNESKHQNSQAKSSIIQKSTIYVDENGWRTILPAKMLDRSQISIWSILKQFIGKELSKIAMPAAWCEPLSFLQRITENVYYSDLLNKASDPTISMNPCKRMEYIAAFAVTNISSNIDRLSKPFNPLLGETYELIREDLGFRIVCEQVSHHPPVSAFHADSTNQNNDWKYYGSVNPKIKFWGKSIEVSPKGILTLELNKFNETYTWQTVTCCVHNIIVGKLWFEYYGTMEIVCHQTGYKAIVNFKPYSWLNKELHKFDGYIYDNKKNKLRAIFGYWTHCFYSCDAQMFDNYVKLNKPLPTLKIDEVLNELKSNNNVNNLNLNRHNHSESELKSINIKKSHNSSNLSKQTSGFTLNEETDENRFENKNFDLDDSEIQISLKKNDLSSTASLPSTSGSNMLNAIEIWRAVPRPSYAEDYYNFNYFAITLNEMKDEFEKIIAPTDSRFRTDIKQLELGDLDAASKEKNRLEEKQRESRKNRKDDQVAKWFQNAKHPICNEEVWLFTNKYWNRNYSDCLQLY